MLEELSKNHKKWISIALSIAKNKADAEDLVQDMYIKLCQKENLNISYVYMTMKSIFLDAKKKKGIDTLSCIDVNNLEEVICDTDLENNKEFYENCRQIAFNKMKPYERIILHYSYKDGLRHFCRETNISTLIVTNVRNKFKKIIWEESEKLQD